MFGWVRVLLVGLVALSLVYVLASVHARRRCRRHLMRRFDKGDVKGDRDTYIEAGMRDYDRSLRKKLLLGIYIVPFVALVTLIYVMNFM